MKEKMASEIENTNENLRVHLRNRLTFAKTVLSVACDRALTAEEASKAIGQLDDVIKICDSEITLLRLKLEA